MDINNLIRDPDKVKACLKTLGDTVVCNKEVKVCFPKRFEDKGLARISGTSSVIGVLAFIVEDKYYSVMKGITRIPFSQDEIKQIELDGESYYILTFREGSKVIPNLNCLREDTLAYYLYDLLISKGKVPWYLDYNDMCKLFDTAAELAGANLGDRPEILSMMISLIARDPKDLTRYYRQVSDDKSITPVYTPMKSVEYGATSTFTKMAGNYLTPGIISSLINPSGQVGKIEAIVRA